MLLVQFGQIIESDPAFTVLYAVQFLLDLLLGMTSSLDDFPKSKELCLFNSSVLVYIDLVEKLGGRYLCKARLPMFQSFGLINYITSVNVENCEHF